MRQRLLCGIIAGLVCLGCVYPVSAAETVHFRSADGQTNLVGYLYLPPDQGPHPAVIMLHGRAGAYSSLAHGVYNADTLSKRHTFWGEFWASHGYVALLVDSFGPRGYWQGFPRHSYANRQSEVSEQTVRPLDAYGALAYVQSRADVMPNRIGLQGWSNGGMTALVTMSKRAPGIPQPTPDKGFRAALVFYPGCGMEAVQGSYAPYAPILLFVALADEEVSPMKCENLAQRVRTTGGPLELITYPGAEHSFDDPSTGKQRHQANATATQDAVQRAEKFFEAQLK